MANKIGSEFIEDFELDKSDWNQKVRWAVFAVGLVLGFLVTIAVIWLEYPDSIFYAFDFLVVLPMCFYGISADKKFKLKERIYFLTLETVRTYGTEIDDERS